MTKKNNNMNVKTVNINLNEILPYQRLRIEFLKEVKERYGMVILFFLAFGSLGCILSLDQFLKGTHDWYLGFLPFVLIATMYVANVHMRKKCYSFLYDFVDKTYRYCRYDYKNKKLIHSNEKIQYRRPKRKGVEKMMMIDDYAERFLWIDTSSIKIRKRNHIYLIEQIGGIFYYCFLWPLIFNPLQLAFLEYDRAKKHIDIKKGSRMLVLGAGAIPHHIRYKRLLGPTGEMVVTDTSYPALWMSRIIEYIYEMIFKLLQIPRTKVTYQYVDATNEFPFEDSTFSSIVGVRNYVADYDECSRILKEDGQMYFTNLGRWNYTKPPKELVSETGEWTTYTTVKN